MEHTGSSTETPEADDLLPSSAEVLGELEELREHRGISPSKIRDVAPFIQRLPITEDQRLFKRLSPDDRHVAAYAAIGCVLDHAIPDVISQQILILTLRYDYNLLTVQPREGWENAWRGPSLTARHNLVMALLQYGRSRYYELMRLAYDELAGQLLLRESTPCRLSAARQVAQVPVELALDQLLGLFSLAGRDLLRERLASQALARVDARWQASGNTAIERLVSVVRQALASEYPAAAQAFARAKRERHHLQSGSRRFPSGGYTIEGDDLHHLIAGDPKRSFWERVHALPRLLTTEAVWAADGDANRVDTEPTYLFRQIGDSYGVLARLLSEGVSVSSAATASAEVELAVEVVEEDDLGIADWLKGEE